MSFRLEKDMTELLLDNIYVLIDSFLIDNYEKILVRKEHSVHARIIDLVVFIWDDYIDNSKFIELKKQLKKLKPIDLAIMGIFTTNKRVSVNKIKKTFCLEYQDAKNNLDYLCELDFLERVTPYSYTAINDWISLVPKDSLSIELKRSKWKEALNQGITNKDVSDYSIVILDEDELPKMKQIESFFENENIGMITMNTFGELFFKVKPNKINEYSYLNSYEKINILKKIDVV